MASPKRGQEEAAPRRSFVHPPNVFECSVLPPVNSFSGTMVPRAMLKRGRRRRVSIEVHRVESAVGETGDTQLHRHAYEECIVRILVPSVEEHRESVRRSREKRQHDDGEDFSDDVSASGHSVAASTMAGHDQYYGSNADLMFMEGWHAKYRFPIKALAIKGSRKRSLVVEISLERRTDVREIIFDTLEDADSFESILNQEIENDRERSNAKFRSILSTTDQKISISESMTYLVEIVSARDLPVADMYKQSSDPFVICLFNGQEIHRTGVISSNLNPVWTVANGSLFLFTATVEELLRSDGILCVVYDYDMTGGNDRLGAITLEPTTIFEGKGDRLEYKLGPPPGKTASKSGYVAVRVRLASDHDKKFMYDLTAPKHKSRSIGEVDTGLEQQGGASNIKSIITRKQRTNKSGAKEYKVRPGPDPEREEETKWMTDDDLQEEVSKESKAWVDCGSGSLGRLFVEVLGCDGLPNLDAGGFAGNKSDAFCSLVFEDVAAKTDIIDDCLSPRWMPWTKRAFIFHIYHSSSQLYLGVFDFDDSVNPADSHDLVGRVSVDLSNLRKDTTYTLTYNLCTTALMTDRKRKGTVTIRVRLEIEDERKLILATLEPPPQMYANVKSRKDFQVVRATVYGKVDMQKYSQKVINSYIDELLALQHASFYVQDALTDLLLWRGSLSLGKFKFWLPVHSLTIYVALIHVVENPNLVPSFIFGSLAWLMVSTMTYRQSLPDIWDRCKSYRECAEAIVFGAANLTETKIRPNQNAKKAEEYYEAWRKRIEDAETAATKAYEEQLQAQREHEKEVQEYIAGDGDLADRKEGVSVDPFKPFIYPIQQCLAVVCRYVRHTKHVLTWQECYIAFWLTTASAILSVMCAFVPWMFFLKWTARLTVWVLFGPWMKLVDVYYVSKIRPLTPEEEEEKKRLERERQEERTFAAVSLLRVKHENKVKLKAMKTHLFGKYIVRVPLLKEERYRDLPLPGSHAEPYVESNHRSLGQTAMLDAGYQKTRIPSQHLVGDMIPCAESVGFTEASPGQVLAYPSRIEKRAMGTVSTGSTQSSYIQLVSLLVAAAAISWVVIPPMAHAADQINWFLSYSVVGWFKGIPPLKSLFLQT